MLWWEVLRFSVPVAPGEQALEDLGAIHDSLTYHLCGLAEFLELF